MPWPPLVVRPDPYSWYNHIRVPKPNCDDYDDDDEEKEAEAETHTASTSTKVAEPPPTKPRIANKYVRHALPTAR